MWKIFVDPDGNASSILLSISQHSTHHAVHDHTSHDVMYRYEAADHQY